jgi:heme/copper-type cytochrome/quinol oxidase subunit 1
MRLLVETVRFVGIVLFLLGVMCMPVGYGVNPRRDQSVFHNLADMNAFVVWGAALGACGLVLLVVASIFSVRRNADR